ncbi:thiol peroxidase [Halothiobacillus diazotrophicus]|uniref:thioredoxin-dependent peroxiredoxin n=1 Tax=Halothiobacillus diazotrophicus TaxID=1860122 RepID=A0A191ZJ46_9GAMM|nr:peroxiredoxin [Halothiobacillus diazotrophicus]ANJ67863.1 thiol peroxidase [Halothiobacillus diazotrophicus]
MPDTELTLGHPIPPFAGRTADGSTIDHSTYLGQWLVLYFYPRDSTPGCTTEAQDFQRLLPEFSAANAVVVGVSNDSPASHEKFCAKQGLTFPLIADTERTVSLLFDVIRVKKMYGKTFEGIERSTFLIDPEGRLHAEWRKVKVPGHAEAVLAAIRA